MRMLLTLVVNAVALWVATLVVPGIALVKAHRVAPGGADTEVNEYTGSTILALAGVALVFAVVNWLVKPLVQLLSLPLTMLTLGLFLLVVNALMLWLTGWWTEQLRAFGAVYVVQGFGAAFWGGIVVGLVNWALGWIVPNRRD